LYSISGDSRYGKDLACGGIQRCFPFKIWRNVDFPLDEGPRIDQYSGFSENDGSSKFRFGNNGGFVPWEAAVEFG
jgi:hypothetical protein